MTACTASSSTRISLWDIAGCLPGWWRRWHGDSDEQLDNAHLMRLAGRFARRVRASARAHGSPVIDCKAEDRKHQIAEKYLVRHPVRSVLVLVAGRGRRCGRSAGPGRE